MTKNHKHRYHSTRYEAMRRAQYSRRTKWMNNLLRYKFIKNFLYTWQEALLWLFCFTTISLLVIVYMNVKVSGNFTAQHLQKKKHAKEEYLKVNQVLREALQLQKSNQQTIGSGANSIISPLAKNKIVRLKLADPKTKPKLP